MTSSSLWARSPISFLAASQPGASMSAGRQVIGSSSPMAIFWIIGSMGAGGLP